MDSAVSGVLAAGVIFLIFHTLYQPKHPVPLPPGPKGHLIFGTALEVSERPVHGHITNT